MSVPKLRRNCELLYDKVISLQTQVITLNSDIIALEKERANAMETGDKDTSFIDKLLKAQRAETSTGTRMK